MIVSSAELVADAKAQIKTIKLKEAKALYGQENVLFVDIRDVRELDREGKIPGALHAPRGMLEFWVDPQSRYYRKEFSPGKKLVLFCAAGWRSALATKALNDMGVEHVCDIAGGFDAWKKAGGAVELQKSTNTRDEAKADNRIPAATKTLARLGRSERLGQQIAFILEIDRLKQIWRQTPLLDYSRKENDAEHSWQLAMMALVLAEYAPAKIDLLRVIKMVLIHDIVEIDAGDSPAYSGINPADQHAAEKKAAKRLFGLLPGDPGVELRALWDEFEDQQTSDALFARAMDRLQPFLHNFFTEGKMWIKRNISAAQVRERMAIVARGSPLLHALVEDLITKAVDMEYLRR